MIHQHLLQRAASQEARAATHLAGAHLDEDALSAFVEGRLSDPESAPLISHLVSCHTCRRFTAELVRLDAEVGPSEAPALPPRTTAEPGRIRSLLEDLASRVLPDSDEVFAYHAPADDFQPRAEGEDDERPAAATGAKKSNDTEDETDGKSE
jgi:anti-sigma factor RsiW